MTIYQQRKSRLIDKITEKKKALKTQITEKIEEQKNEIKAEQNLGSPPQIFEHKNE